MYILGVSPFHDSSVCVLKNGKIDFFLKEERVSRIKRDSHPFKSLDMISSIYDKVDYSVICSPSNGNESLFAYKAYLKKAINSSQVYDISDQHHLQHASLAFYNSGFSNAIVVVIDRNGSFVGSSCRESESVFYAEYPNNFTALYKSYHTEPGYDKKITKNDLVEKYKNNNKTTVKVVGNHGIVRAYESATTLIQENVLENGKTMGLSAYGEYRKDFDNIFINNEYVNEEVVGVGKYEGNFNVSINKEYYPLATNKLTQENHKLYSDYAFAVQKQTQEAALKIIEEYVLKTGINNVCVTGGYGLNVLANSFYKKMMPEVNFYFEPMADDSGNSIGGAMLIYRELTNDMGINKLQHTFFHGSFPNFSNVSGTACNQSDIIEYVIEKKSVAIFNGKSEAGPRALGNRSIIFDPRVPNAKDLINIVKNREWYRPFAAMVLEEDAHLYFDMIFESSKFMTTSFNSTDYAKKSIPGVLHVDGTCRIQTVSKENKLIYGLLTEMKNKTGHGVLLNTSFNLAGEPLVETPEQAIDVLNRSNLDILWFPEVGVYKVAV